MKRRTAPSSFHHRPIEVHDPALCLDLGWGKLSVGPLGNEICQDLGFDRLARCIGEGLSYYLHGPLGYPTRDFPVVDYLLQREGQDHGYGVSLEVVA